MVSSSSKGQDRNGEENFGSLPRFIEVMQQRPIVDVLRDHTDRLMDLPGVVGIGHGLCDGQPCIKVMVVKKTPELLEQIPASLEGYRVEVEETGVIRALD